MNPEGVKDQLLDCSSNPNYPQATAGDGWTVSVAGKIGGSSGKAVSVGQRIICTADTNGGTEASVAASFVVRGTSRILTAATTLTARDEGTYYLNSATEFAVTLPAPVIGLTFRFFVSAAPSGASYTIVTASSANIIKGQVFTSDVNSATDADFETSGGDTISFVDGVSVAGDMVELVSDGTNWFARGFCSVYNAITITTAS